MSKNAGNKIRRGKKYFNANVERLQSKRPSELSLGERLTLIRVEHSLSQEAFGKSIGKSKTAITQYEMGSSQADYHTIRLISEIYNVSYDYLFGYSDSKVREQHSLKSITGFNNILVDKILFWSNDEYGVFEKSLTELIYKGGESLDDLLFFILDFGSLHEKKSITMEGDGDFLSDRRIEFEYKMSGLSLQEFAKRYYTQQIENQKMRVFNLFVRLIDKVADKG